MRQAILICLAAIAAPVLADETRYVDEMSVNTETYGDEKASR